jgi:hypothetical protein
MVIMPCWLRVFAHGGTISNYYMLMTDFVVEPKIATQPPVQANNSPPQSNM